MKLNVGAYVERRTKKNKFFNQIDSVIDCQPIEKGINKAYKKGNDVVGRKAYSGLMLFKCYWLGFGIDCQMNARKRWYARIYLPASSAVWK